ncbi:DUF1501 domain-containing protein [bacterium]|nr:DUF1501 domain-containing protein [bacterium]QQR57345.1 MAG: DUF1501 domain-containing protein [Candidatus Melainabacteria bacterium]
MNRREFLKSAALASCSLMAPGMEAWALESKSAMKSGSKLVVVFLRGAIDGLSVLPPIADSRYYSLRPRIAIPGSQSENGALYLDGHFGMHPALAPIMPLWKSKKLAFVLNAGSPNPTRSHFDAQDYMESGVPGSKSVSTGWLNRLLSQLPTNDSPVRAINIGATTPRILSGPVAVATYAPTAKRRMAPLDQPQVSAAFSDMYSGRNDILGKTFEQGMAARGEFNQAFENSAMQEMVAADGGALPANKFNGFGRQLGRLMKEEPKVQVAFLALGGFDTHVNQGASQGQLSNQLSTVAKGLSELTAALDTAFNNTMIVVVSEFGRTVKENGNGGTDHGHGNLIWLMGNRVNGGKLYGNWSGLDQNSLFEGRDLPVMTDFRNVLASGIGNHMGLAAKQKEIVFPGYQPNDKTVTGIFA